MWYVYLKTLHVTFVTLSITGFVLRGLIALHAPERLHGWWRRLPHVNDTLLLITGVTLAVRLHFNPLEQPWLLAKLVALVLYIVLGAVTLSRRPLARRTRLLAGGAALLVFGYIVAAALTKQVLPVALF